MAYWYMRIFIISCPERFRGRGGRMGDGQKQFTSPTPPGGKKLVDRQVGEDLHADLPALEENPPFELMGFS